MSGVGALSGLKVLELGELTAAPYATKLFGDFGAEVIKLEPRGTGDESRTRGPFPEGRSDPERSGSFLYLNTNKLSVTLDLDHVIAKPILQRLLGWADILVTNYSLQRLHRWEITPDGLRDRFPSLIVTSISPFGLNGPYAEYLGDELITAATGGLLYSTPGMPDAVDDPERDPPLHPDCAIADTVTGLVAACASMVAVFGRLQSGSGCHVDVSQQAAVAAMQQRDVSMSSYSGTAFNRVLNPAVIGRMPNFYLPCKDGYVVIAAFLDHQWRNLVRAMGSPAWALSSAFADERARTANWIALRLRLMEWTINHSGDELSEISGRLQLPLFPFHSIGEMVTSEQVAHRESLVQVFGLPSSARMPSSPVAMDGTPCLFRRPAPRLGQHTREVLCDWLGVPAVEADLLVASGAA